MGRRPSVNGSINWGFIILFFSQKLECAFLRPPWCSSNSVFALVDRFYETWCECHDSGDLSKAVPLTFLKTIKKMSLWICETDCDHVKLIHCARRERICRAPAKLAPLLGKKEQPKRQFWSCSENTQCPILGSVLLHVEFLALIIILYQPWKLGGFYIYQKV